MDRKGRFSIEDHIWCILTQSKKWPFDPNCFDRAIRSAHPVEKDDFIDGMRGSDCSIKKLFEAKPRLSPPQKTHDHTLQQLLCRLDFYCCCRCCCCSSQRVSVAHPVLRPPAARIVIRWQQCMLLLTTLLQHRCCCCARFGACQRVLTRQLRR